MQKIKDNKIIFSIAIPTHNRSTFVNKNIQSLYENNFFDLDYVELLISDNSTDLKTKSLVTKYNFKNIRYIKVSPCTYKENWLNCLNFSSGKYILILGDDDILDKLLINHLSTIIQKEFSLAIFKGIGYENKVPTNFESDLSFKHSSDPAEFLKFAGTKITFISSIIINKQLIIKDKHKIKNELNENLVQLDFIMHLLKKHKQFLLINNYLVYAYSGNNAWGYSGLKLFSSDLNKYMKKYLNQNEIRIVNNAFLSSFFPFEIYKIRMNSFQFDPKILINLYDKYLLFKLLVYPLLKIPKFLLPPIAVIIIIIGKIINREAYYLFKKLKNF
jgi:abequosyltransferase